MGKIYIEKGYILHLNNHQERVNNGKWHNQIPWKGSKQNFQMQLQAESEVETKIRQLKETSWLPPSAKNQEINRLRWMLKWFKITACKRIKGTLKPDKTLELLAAIGKVSVEDVKSKYEQYKTARR